MIFNRNKYLEKLYKYLDTEKLIFLLGSRQSGKTTLLKILYNDDGIKLPKYYVNMEDIFDISFSDKDSFINYISFKYKVDFYKSGILLLDEIQYIKNIETILKSIYDDENIKLQIIGTGSGIWQLSEFGSSLVGRKVDIYVYPFDFFEFLEYKGVDTSFLEKNKYTEVLFKEIEKYLIEFYKFGGYPEVVMTRNEDDKIEKLGYIIDTYINKDVKFLLSGEDIINFKKLFAYLSYNVGDLLKIEKLANYLGINAYKIEKYIQLFEKSFILYKSFPFSHNVRYEYSKQPQMFFNDLGILNYFRNNFQFVDYDGKLVENLVFLELQKNKVSNFDDIKFYKKYNGSEIDFIYQYRKGGVLPIEIKLQDKDNIPQIFKSFAVQSDTAFVNKFVKTTKSKIFDRSLNDKEVEILPFWLISRIL